VKKEIPDQLILDIVNEKVVPFIGAGFSRSFGYPGWRDLLKKLAEKIKIKDLVPEDIEKGDPLQIAQAFFQHFKEEKKPLLIDKLINQFNIETLDKNDKKSDTYQILWQTIDLEAERILEQEFSTIMLDLIKPNSELKNEQEINKLKKLKNIKFHYIVTTNYDKVIEQEIYNDNEYEVLYPGKGLELNWNEHDKTVLKIHGDKESSDGIVFTHQQYYKFMHEYGFFRSKLYTFFSTNTILMMGYGFNDINIHHIYLQFIRDYGKNLSSHKKLYMLLTHHDQKNWGSYFKYYKKYLESYNVQVIEYKDLPTFVEDLVTEVENEKHSSSIVRLFSVNKSNLPTYLLSLIRNELSQEDINGIDKETGKALIISITKIFRNPNILTAPPFNYSVDESGINQELAIRFVDTIYTIVKNHISLAEKEEYFNLLNEFLKYASEAISWYTIHVRVKSFYKLAEILNYEPNEKFNIDVGGYFSSILMKSHPTKYLYAFDAGQFILDKLSSFPVYYIKSYLIYLKDYIEEKKLDIYPGISDYWVNKIKSKLEYDSEVLDLCNEIDSIIRKNYKELNEELELI
jgi:hypothetical protein